MSIRNTDYDDAGGESALTEDFLERWSRRKREAQGRGHAGEPTSADARETAPVAVSVEDAVIEQPPLTDADMPPVDQLNDDSDYSGFLSPGVSEELRKVALRKLFQSAKFNVCDGLDDYAEDFRTFEPLGDVVTAEMRHRIEREAERMRELLADEATEVRPEEDTEAGAAAGEADEGISVTPSAEDSDELS